MAERYRGSCLDRVHRPANEELCALMADVLEHDTPASLQLIATVTPLLLAFFEGQVQAARVERDSVDALVQQAFMTLHRRRADYDVNTPFRAWLIYTARDTLLEHLRSQPGAEVVAPAASTSLLNRHQAQRAI
ncbi:RNA polymerase sigma factor [compost metagenome]